MVKKTKLIIDYEFDFDLIGIISPVKEYKLAWHLNNMLHIHLVKNRDIELEFINSNIFISNFDYSAGNSTFRLVKNKNTLSDGTMAFLLPEMREFDYLIMLEGEGDTFDTDTILNALKSDGFIQYITLVDIDRLKSKDNLIF